MKKLQNSSIERVNALCFYAIGLAQRTNIPESDRRRIDDECQTIAKRLQDPNLYLGVVGEFSTGKSTFINALLGMELLREDILQGTTCAPTLLSAGPEFGIRVEFATGRVIRYPRSSVSAASKWSVGDSREHALECVRKASASLHKYTADEEHSKNVRLVRISIPSDCWHLPENVVVVDTPGLNSDNPRHGEVTRQAVQDVCDLCCVLTSASTPCPSSLTGFLSENLREDSGRCVGVVTQIDRLRKRERDGAVRYVAERLESEGLPFREVVGVSPLAVVHPEEAGAEGETLRTEFDAFTKRLSELLREGRDAAITGKVAQLARHLADKTLLPILSEKKKVLNERKTRLKVNQLSDPNGFLKTTEEKAARKVSDIFQESAQGGKPKLDETIDSIRQSIETKINEAIIVSDVKGALQGASVSQRLKKTMGKCLEQCGAEGSHAATQFLAGFRGEFNNAYRDLAGKTAKTPEIKQPDIFVSVPDIDLSDAIGAISLLDDQDDEQRMGSAAKGAAAGAAVGSFIPILGTLTGALIGGALGGIFGGKDISEFKTKARGKLGEAIRKLRTATKSAYDRQADTIEQSILDSVKKQLGLYRAHVPEILAIIEAERAEQSLLQTSIADIEKDMKMLRSYL